MEGQERLSRALADRYRIEGEIGSGGMATVYLAEDLKHDRKVAVKVLKPELAAVVGTERFLAEIRTTANLSHPHILPLFDSGEADGFLFYVMPFVEGESLRERLDRDGQLPVEEAVSIASHVADALEYAHRQGVIHRDIKPGNILFQAGDPVVTDFGIALAVSAAGEGRLTETGLSLGTPYYMSPEQAAGEDTPTPASDVYSLGCVLYEMLTGDPPHTGSSAQAILGKILLGEVTSPTKLRRTIPANVEGALLRALERLPADRFSSVAGLAAALKDKGFRHGIGAEQRVAGSPGPWRGMALILGALAVLSLAAGITGILGPDPDPPPTVRNQIWLGSDISASEIPVFGLMTALAPDGSSFVFPDTLGVPGDSFQLFLKRRDEVEVTPIPGTIGAFAPTFSPDGEWILYQLEPTLIKRSLSGGGAVTLAEGLAFGYTQWSPLAWLDDGTILYKSPGEILTRIPEDASAPPDTVYDFGPPDEEQALLVGLSGLPGGRAALAVTCPTGGCPRARNLSVVDLQRDTAWVVLEDVVRAWYVPTGHLVYVRADGVVFGTPFDPEKLEVGSGATPLFDGVRGGVSWADMHVAEDGTVLYIQGRGQTRRQRELVWVDRTGENPELAHPGLELGDYRTVSLSPDGRWLALSRMDSTEQIFVTELPDGPLTRLTTDSGRSQRPVWSHDMETLTYISTEGGATHARTVRADGSTVGASEILLEREKPVLEVAYTPDGQGLLFREGNSGAGEGDLGFLDLASGEVQGGILASEFNERGIALSPDGRWLAYVSDQTGRNEVFVRPFPSVGRGSTQVSTAGGSEPVWAHNGRELFFRDAEQWMNVATYSADSLFTVESRELLFNTGWVIWSSDYHCYDVDPADERFLMITFTRMLTRDESEGAVIMIQNWFTELEERLGGK